MTTLHLRKSISRLPWRRGFVLIPLALTLALFALSSTVRAVIPPPDGGYPVGNTAEGQNALFSLTTGSGNTATGFLTLFENTSGFYNTAHGDAALYHNTTGNYNTANGWRALYNNRTGFFNLANGFEALYSNTTGYSNTANGAGALYSNTNGGFNTATGLNALNSNISGGNTANGALALQSNTRGSGNLADGYEALEANTTASNNTAIGCQALSNNTTGFSNTAIGYQALSNTDNATGSRNIALGVGAGSNLASGNDNILIGSDGGDTGDGNFSDTIRIGEFQRRTFIAGIWLETTGSTTTLPVIVDLNGQLGTAASSERFKTEIKPMDKSSEAILALKPATFQYKNDSKGRPQFGLIAEEVAKVNPDLVVRDAQGQIYTVRYEAVNAMLLNEFLKEHRKVQDLEATVAQQQKGFEARIAHQQKQIEALTAGLERVSAQVQMSRPAPQMVGNDQ